MRIAALQARSVVGEVAADTRREAADANLAALDDAAARAAQEGADVIVTPELFVTGYAPNRLHDVDPNLQIHVTQELAAIARRHRIAVLASYPEVEFLGAADQAQQFIAATLFTADGESALHYRKVNLFDDDEARAFTAGTDAPTCVEIAGMRVAVVICFDVEYPETVRAAALAGADVVLAPTALTPGFDDVPNLLVRARALENGLAIAYVNHAGVEDGLTLAGGSVIVGPDGGVLAQGDASPDLLIADVTPDAVAAAREAVPYVARLRRDTYAAWQ